jgi:hypothetical protein
LVLELCDQGLARSGPISQARSVLAISLSIEMSSNGTPDLASVLKTLAGLAPQNQQQSHATYPVQQQQAPQAWPQNPQAPQSGTQAQAPKVIDPATIIDWSAGLRCVMKTVAKHENILHDIRRVICAPYRLSRLAYSRPDDQGPT